MTAGTSGKALRAWLAVLLCIAVIWTLSGESFSGYSTSRIVGPLLRWLFPDISHETLRHAHFLVRKGAHLTEYAVLAVLSFRALRLSLHLSLLRVIGLALGLVLAVAGADELRQSLLPMRTGSLADVTLDFAGGALGLGLIIALHRWLGIGPPPAREEP
jgi:VanZ family protein